MTRRFFALAATAALCAALVACTPKEAPAMILDDAKADYLAVESELIAFVPESAVEEDLGHREKSSLLPCPSDEALLTWPGSAAVRIDPATDTDAILADIAAEWDERSDWTQERRETSGGTGYLVLTRDDGLSFDVGAIEGNTIFQVAGFSTCFALDDHDPLEQY